MILIQVKYDFFYLKNLDFPRGRSWIGTVWNCLWRETPNQAARGCDQGR